MDVLELDGIEGMNEGAVLVVVWKYQMSTEQTSFAGFGGILGLVAC